MPHLLPSDERVLLAVWHLGAAAYGVRIRHFLVEVTGATLSHAAIYTPLERMAREGYLAPRQVPPVGRKGGRPRRYFTLTPKGLDALHEARQVHEALWRGFPA